MKRIALSLVLLLSVSAFAQTASKLSVKELVDQFYAHQEAAKVTSQSVSPITQGAPPATQSAATTRASQSLAKSLQNFGLNLEAYPPSRRPRGPRCPPPQQDPATPHGPSCSDVACDKLGVFGCDTMDEVSEVNRACRGNVDGTCMNVVCDKLGVFGCDTIGEATTVARSCVGNYDTDCFEKTCDRLGVFGCDTMGEVQQVLNECAGN